MSSPAVTAELLCCVVLCCVVLCCVEHVTNKRTELNMVLSGPHGPVGATWFCGGHMVLWGPHGSVGPAAPWSTFLGWDQDSDQDQSLCRVSLLYVVYVCRPVQGRDRGRCVKLPPLSNDGSSLLRSWQPAAAVGLRHTAAGVAAHRRFTLTPRLIAASITSQSFFDWTMFRQLCLQKPTVFPCWIHGSMRRAVDLSGFPSRQVLTASCLSGGERFVFGALLWTTDITAGD